MDSVQYKLLMATIRKVSPKRWQTAAMGLVERVLERDQDHW
jgi:hypothetical protein